MKRTTSTLAALGLALSGSVALAGAYIPPGGRVERQPAADQDRPRDAAPRPDGGQGGPRGGGWGNSRDGRRADRGTERRDDRRHDGRGDARRWGGDHDHGPARGWRDARGREWRYRREWYDQYRADRWRYDRGRWVARERYSIGIYVIPRGYPVRYWQRGQWLPAAYYAERRWHLGDYWRYGLYDPPYAAGWVRVGDDALLVDLRSGEVLDVVCELFW